MSLTQIANSCGTDKGSYQGFTALYEKYLPGRKAVVNLVELGVYRGASLRMWANYFQDPRCSIWGVDISLDQYDGMMDSRVRTITGDQTDRGIACAVGTIPGWLDIVIDDASHEAEPTIGAFNAWWPYVKAGGLYVIEDTHCSYNTDHYRSAGEPLPLYDEHWPEPTLAQPKPTMMDFIKRLADDVNWGIHGYDRFEPMFKDVAFVHFYPGIAFIGKKV